MLHQWNTDLNFKKNHSNKGKYDLNEKKNHFLKQINKPDWSNTESLTVFDLNNTESIE